MKFRIGHIFSPCMLLCDLKLTVMASQLKRPFRKKAPKHQLSDTQKSKQKHWWLLKEGYYSTMWMHVAPTPWTPATVLPTPCHLHKYTEIQRKTTTTTTKKIRTATEQTPTENVNKLRLSKFEKTKKTQGRMWGALKEWGWSVHSTF